MGSFICQMYGTCQSQQVAVYYVLCLKILGSPSFAGHWYSPCKENQRRMNYHTPHCLQAISEQYSFTSRNTSASGKCFPKGTTITDIPVFSFVSNFIFLERQYLKISEIKKFPLVHCCKISTPHTAFPEVCCLVSRKRVVLCVLIPAPPAATQ